MNTNRSTARSRVSDELGISEMRIQRLLFIDNVFPELIELIDEGKLNWDDRVVDVLPGFRMYDAYATAEMRVRDLLSHKSGLTRGDASWYASPRTQKEVFHSNHFIIYKTLRNYRTLCSGLLHSMYTLFK